MESEREMKEEKGMRGQRCGAVNIKLKFHILTGLCYVGIAHLPYLLHIPLYLSLATPPKQVKRIYMIKRLTVRLPEKPTVSQRIKCVLESLCCTNVQCESTPLPEYVYTVF